MAKVKGRLDIDKEKCKGCEVCTTVCPFQILEMRPQVNGKGYHYPFVNDPERCTGCTNCAVVCPDSCIVVFRTREA